MCIELFVFFSTGAPFEIEVKDLGERPAGLNDYLGQSNVLNLSSIATLMS